MVWNRIKIPVKILLLFYLLTVIFLYWKNYGVDNFLWLSDIGLFLTIFGIIFESPLAISMAAIGVLFFEIAWMIDYFLYLLLDRPILGISDYMFNPQYSPFLRGLSLFHIVNPIIWIVLIYKWGYDKRAFLYQIILTWLVLSLSFFCTNPAKNINWVFVPYQYHWTWMPASLWFVILLIGIPLFFILPLHILFKRFCKAS